MSFIKGVKAVAEPVAKDDRPPADGLCDRRVLTLGVAGDVDAATERQRPRVQGFRQARLAGTDDPGEHNVGGGDEAPLVQGPRVVDEAAARVEVLPDEHPVRAKAAFGQERVLPGEGCGGVLVLREMKPAGRAERRRPRFTAGGQVGRCATLGLLRIPLGLRIVLAHLPGFGLDLGGGFLACLAVPAPLALRADQDAGVQPALLRPAHSDRPWPGDVVCGARANQSVASTRAARAGARATLRARD